MLTATNEEALQIAGMLLNKGMQTSLIQTNEGFNLYNLLEIRTFLSLLNIDDGVVRITEEQWEEAVRTLKKNIPKKYKMGSLSKYDQSLRSEFRVPI